MRKILTYAVSALALASCSSDSLVGDSPVTNEAPIAFNVGLRNITRAVDGVDDSKNLEKNGYYDFGVWAYKYKEASSTLGSAVMNNYKVAYDNSAWGYVGVNGQVERYWDLSYNNTKFFAYAPYSATGVVFTESTKTITVPASVNAAGTSKDFIYATKSETNALSADGTHTKVQLQFKHLGAKVNLAFRENVDGYKVELIDVKSDKEGESGIQLIPANESVSGETKTYTKGSYTTQTGATINFSNPSEIAVTTVSTEAKTDDKNLTFALPTGNLTAYPKTESKYNVLPEVPTEGTATYAVSPTTYYAVVQPEGNSGFTLHISYKLIAEDNGEEIIVRDARAFIPANQAKWESNKAYTYNFTIQSSSTGNTSGTVDLTDYDPTKGGLIPIVFDTPTITDYDSPAVSYDPSI
jgi:hypothetical protein